MLLVQMLRIWCWKEVVLVLRALSTHSSTRVCSFSTQGKGEGREAVGGPRCQDHGGHNPHAQASAWQSVRLPLRAVLLSRDRSPIATQANVVLTRNQLALDTHPHVQHVYVLSSAHTHRLYCTAAITEGSRSGHLGRFKRSRSSPQR